MDNYLFLKLLVFILFMSLVIALLEIQIEGKNGWAKELPTWRIKNKWTKIFWQEYPLTGYHLYLMLVALGFLHFPFFFGIDWSLSREFIILAIYCLIFLFEDFFWFILNPAYGLRKFHKDHIQWHQQWYFNIPAMYFRFLASAGLFLFLSKLI